MKVTKSIIAFIILLFVCMSPCLAEDVESIELSVNVPFGITVGEEPIPVHRYRRIRGGGDAPLKRRLCLGTASGSLRPAPLGGRFPLP